MGVGRRLRRHNPDGAHLRRRAAARRGGPGPALAGRGLHPRDLRPDRARRASFLVTNAEAIRALRELTASGRASSPASRPAARSWPRPSVARRDGARHDRGRCSPTAAGSTSPTRSGRDRSTRWPPTWSRRTGGRGARARGAPRRPSRQPRERRTSQPSQRPRASRPSSMPSSSPGPGPASPTRPAASWPATAPPSMAVGPSASTR